MSDLAVILSPKAMWKRSLSRQKLLHVLWEMQRSDGGEIGTLAAIQTSKPKES